MKQGFWQARIFRQRLTARASAKPCVTAEVLRKVRREKMQVRVLLLVVIMVIAGGYAFVLFRSAAHTAAAPLSEPISPGSVPTRIDFTTQVRPILARCQPCHFSGGTMYEKLPFDRPETVTKLGEKLFTRIQADNERKIIREFLVQNEADK